jgi:Phage-related protein
MTPSEFKSTMCLNYLLSGNAYARINRSAGGNYVLSLYPLNAEQVEIVKEKGRVVYYRYMSPNKDIEEIPAKDMIHWKNLGNGLSGLSVKDFARSTLSEAISAQNAAVEVFKNKGKLNGILTADNYMDKGTGKDFLGKLQGNEKNGNRNSSYSFIIQVSAVVFVSC